MVHLTTVSGAFRARVVAARLGADGILVQLRGDWGTTYPVGGPVEILVEPERLEVARELLDADEEAGSAQPGAVGGAGRVPGDRAGGTGRRLTPGWGWLAVAWLVIGVLLALYLLSVLG